MLLATSITGVLVMPISGRMSLAFTSLGRHRGYARIRIEEVHSPKRIGGRRVGVEGVNAVVLRRHNQDIVDAISRNRDLRHVERLRVNVSVHRKRIQPAETFAAFTLSGVRVVSSVF